MEELIKSLTNININSDSAVQIVKYWMVTEIMRWSSMVISFFLLGSFIYIIIKNYGTGKWKSFD